MKRKLMKSLTVLTLVVTMLCSNVVLAYTETVGTGEYSITVINEKDTGITINGDWFHAYQVFAADDATTYAVNENFIDFFSLNGTIGGDGSSYDFADALADIEAAKALVDTEKGFTSSTPQADKDAAYALDSRVKTEKSDYNQLAGKYIESFGGDLYQLAVDMRDYLDGKGIGEHVVCSAHAQAYSDGGSGNEMVKLKNLTGGYYFVLDEDSTIKGLGVASSGAFVPVGEHVEKHPEIKVKNRIPTVDKKILHNDLDGSVSVPGSGSEDGLWDIVGDYQIGDKAHFLVTSTLPTNISDYTDYTYILRDTMSNGLSYNGDAAIYLDKAATMPLNDSLYIKTIIPNGFEIDLDVEAVKAAYSDVSILYTHYSGLVTAEAVTSKDYEDNTIELEFSNDPDDSTKTGTAEDKVYSYTFDFAINKVDETNNGLPGVQFGLYEGSTFLPVKLVKTVAGVDYYVTSDSSDLGSDLGYIVTKDNGGVVGKFVINGLDDQITYMIKEEKTPSGYNPIDPFTFKIEANYNDTTGQLITLTSNNPDLSASKDGFEADIINRRTVFLPSTGGMGTVIFQVLGGGLMVGAAAYLALSAKKKSNKES